MFQATVLEVVRDASGNREPRRSARARLTAFDIVPNKPIGLFVLLLCIKRVSAGRDEHLGFH